MLYELIIFTMMSDHVKPKWQHMKPTSEIVCIKRMEKFNNLFLQIDGLVFSVSCKPIMKDKK